MVVTVLAFPKRAGASGLDEDGAEENDDDEARLHLEIDWSEAATRVKGPQGTCSGFKHEIIPLSPNHNFISHSLAVFSPPLSFFLLPLSLSLSLFSSLSLSL